MSAKSVRRTLVMHDAQFRRDRISRSPCQDLSVLGHSPLHVVVDHYRHRQMLPDRGVELRKVEPYRPVPDHAYHLSFWIRGFGRKSEGDPDSETSQVTMAQE